MAADAIYFTANTRKITEGSSLVVTARFRNTGSNADVTPTNVNYRIDEPVSRCIIQDWTAVTPGASVAITTSPDNNRVRNCLKATERRVLTVSSDYGLSTQIRDSFQYELKNLPTVST